MAQQIEDVVISSLRGGQNDTDPPQALDPDECVLARNVEFFESNLGERRNGCAPLDITGSNLASGGIIVHLSQWFPTNVVTDPEFIAVSANPTVNAFGSARTGGTWAALTFVDAMDVTVPRVYEMVTQPLNGKLFVAYNGNVDRMHVKDPGSNTIRRSGIAQPAAAPTVANEGVGVYNGVRYFRIRFTKMSGTTVLLRSEPSATATFTPNGTSAGARITRPGTTDTANITHWEVEASNNNADFYRIATVAIGTTTYDDETSYTAGYANSGPLSEDIGDNSPLPNARYLTVDGNRLIFAGHFTDTSRQSQVGWTPVTNAPGVGNDERLPADTNNTEDLDNYDGGPITGIMGSNYGVWYAFKWDHIYKALRTGNDDRAYDIVTLSSSRGAIEGSLVKGIDENGSPCIYFLDPHFGPSRVGSSGIQTIIGLRGTWGTVNLQAASVVARGCWYPYKQQVHWWIATSGAERPNFKMVLQASETRPIDNNAVGRGWSTWDGLITEAAAVAVFTEVVIINGVTQLSDRPFVGLASPNFIQRCDVEATDAGTAYTATIRTRPFFMTGLLQQWGAMSAALLAVTNAAKSLVVKFIRNYGTETNPVTTTLTAPGAELSTIKNFDDLRMSEAICIQVEFTDP
jgi:hypothetical protein